MVDQPDRIIKTIVDNMMSSGIRIRTFDQLKWKHIIPNYSERWEIFVAKIVVYVGINEEYCSFITPEVYQELWDWIDFSA